VQEDNSPARYQPPKISCIVYIFIPLNNSKKEELREGAFLIPLESPKDYNKLMGL
jgi:hypothetical protein